MICKKCSADYSDELAFCPECASKNENENSQGRIDKGMYVLDVSEEDSADSGIPQVEYEAPVYDEAQRLKDAAKESGEIVKRRERIVKEKRKTLIRNKKGKIEKESRKATAMIAILLCAVGLISIMFTVFKVKTDIFEQKAQTQKAVALSNLSAEEESLLEKELALYYSVIKMNYSKDTCDAEKLISQMNPGDTGNIYTVVNSSKNQLQTTADPAKRFADEYGEYSYYKIEKSKVDNVLDRFGISCEGDVNSKNCYYYDGFYYFGNQGMKKTPTVGADISKSKKVLDGSYYVECYFYVTDGSNTVKSDTYYVVAKKNETADADGYNFVINEINSQPIFNASGNPTYVSGASGYKIARKVIEGRTNNGTVYSRYVIEYPVFEGSSVGEASINEFFAGTVTAYELRASSAQKDYAAFVSQGGNAKELPFTETVIARVTCADDEKISIEEKITSYSPEIPVKEEATEANDYYGYGSSESSESEQKAVELPARSVEAYTFDRATGEFIEKDSFIGKNYMVISEILYRIYNSYEYEDIIPDPSVYEPVTESTTAEGNEGQPGEDDYNGESDYDGYNDYDDYDGGRGDYRGYGEEGYGDDVIPEDTYGFGTVIYESACCFTAEGFTFFYVEDEGYITEVTLPSDIVEKLKDSKSVTIE